MKINPCPFCGNTDIRYSIKSTQVANRKPAFHVTCYCNSCHCYGPRILVKVDEDKSQYTSKYEVERNKELEKAAYEAWNKRSNV